MIPVGCKVKDPLLPLVKNLLRSLSKGESAGYLSQLYHAPVRQPSGSNFRSENQYSRLECFGPAFGRYPRSMSSKTGSTQPKQGSGGDDFVEATVAKASDVQEGE